MNYSETLKQLINEGYGYRTESFCGSGVRQAEDVIDFEIGSLGNSDIISYCDKNYNLDLNLDYEIDGEVRSARDSGSYTDEEFQWMIVEEHMYHTENILKYLESQLG